MFPSKGRPQGERIRPHGVAVTHAFFKRDIEPLEDLRLGGHAVFNFSHMGYGKIFGGNDEANGDIWRTRLIFVF